MRVGIVLAKTPAYSETFFISKIKGLQECGIQVVLFVQKKHPKFDLCIVKTAPKIYKRNILLQCFEFVKVLIRSLIHINIYYSYYRLKRLDSSSFIDTIKSIYINNHILNEKLDWLNFGFGTMALGREQLAKAIGAKMAVSFRGYDICIYPVKYPNGYDVLWKYVEKVHSISDDLTFKLNELNLPRRIKIKKITPAIDSNYFVNKNICKSIERKRVNILSVARLHWKKGYVYSLEALAILKNNGVQFKYTIIGEGPIMEELKYTVVQLGLINEVVFLGKLKTKEILNHYESNEIFIQYSISEGFCNAVLEAQASGLLCVVSDAEGLSENILHKETGWVVPKRSPKLLAQKLIEIINLADSEKRTILDNASKRVEKQFNLKKQQLEFQEFYE